MPILFESSEPDGTALAYYYVSESFYIYSRAVRSIFRSRAPSPHPTVVPAFYPGLSDPEVIAAVDRDFTIRWCVLSLVLYEGQ